MRKIRTWKSYKMTLCLRSSSELSQISKMTFFQKRITTFSPVADVWLASEYAYVIRIWALKTLFIQAEKRKQPSRGFLKKGVLKICRKFTGEHPCRSVILINLQSNFIEITLRHDCSPVILLHIFRTPFP